VNLLAETFSASYPGCTLTVHDVSVLDPWAQLRRGEIDVLVFWLVLDDMPDLTAGPVLKYRNRVLMAGNGHRLARRESVSVEDLADERLHDVQGRTDGG
jgi:DNA-binding transcriptional LysR family regulator